MGEQTEETTLDLDSIMDAGMAKFQGELIEAAREGMEVGGRRLEVGGQTTEGTEVGGRTTEDGGHSAITPNSGEKDSPPEGTEVGGEGTEVGGLRSEVGGKKTEDGGRKAEPGGDAPLKKEEGPQFRFKDHAAAEDGYRHLQAAKTKAEQEAARLREELKAAQETEERKKTQEKLDQDLVSFIAEQHERALSQIDDLNPDDESYRKRVSMAWAEKDAAVERWKRQHAPAEVVGPTMQAKEADPSEVWSVVEQRATSAGIDAADEYFRMICTQAPNQTPEGKPIPFDDQISWAVDQTLAYHKKQEQLFQERLKATAQKRAEQDQAASLPLGRSPADRSAGKAQAAPVVTLNDALNAALEERRL